MCEENDFNIPANEIGVSGDFEINSLSAKKMMSSGSLAVPGILKSFSSHI
jgi:hypothetical protein